MQRKFDPESHITIITSIASLLCHPLWFCLVPWVGSSSGAPKLGNKISSSHSIPHNFIWHYPEREKRSLQAALEEQRGSFPFQEHTLALCVGRNRSVDMEIKSDQTKQGILEHGMGLIHLNPESWNEGKVQLITEESKREWTLEGNQQMSTSRTPDKFTIIIVTIILLLFTKPSLLYLKQNKNRIYF